VDITKMPDAVASTGLSDKLQNKRKRQADDSSKQEQPEGAATNAEGSNKKKQKKNKKNKKKTDKDGEQSKKQEDKEGIDESIGKMDGRLLGDHFAQKAKRLDKQLSAVELSDLSVPGAYAYCLSICQWPRAL
jgi:protein CMS1